MNELMFIIEQEEDGAYVAHAVGEAIVTQADSRSQLDEMIRDAIRCHFDRPEDMPKSVRLHFIRDEVLAL